MWYVAFLSNILLFSCSKITRGHRKDCYVISYILFHKIVASYQQNTACWCVCLPFAVLGDVRVSPTYYQANVGEDVTIDCTASSNSTQIWLKLNTWEKRAQYITNSANGKVLNELKEKYRVDEPAAKLSRLTIMDVQPSDEGQFICKESNAGHTIANMTLTMAGRPMPWQITSLLATPHQFHIGEQSTTAFIFSFFHCLFCFIRFHMPH